MELNSKDILQNWKTELEYKCSGTKFYDDMVPTLNIVRIQGDPASEKYVNTKKKVGKEIGINVIEHVLAEDSTQNYLNSVMASFYEPTILQLPLPRHLNHREALRYLSPKVDVDGLTTMQKGMLDNAEYGTFPPATALGVMRLLSETIDLAGKKVAIVSRSELVGKPLAQMVLWADGYPVILHSKVSERATQLEMLSADVIVTACGRRAIFDSRHCGNNQIIIDCSMATDDMWKGVGDFHKEDVLENTHAIIASGYGHTGPATVLGLMSNTLDFYNGYVRLSND